MITNSDFKFAGEIIKPGTSKVILVSAPNMNIQDKTSIPVHIFHGKNPGPKIFIFSGIHGDEINGIEIIRRINSHINPRKLSGTLITLPVINIHGLIMQTRYFSDRRDLNRCFPGKKTGTLAARLAYELMHQIVRHCDYGIDLHTGSIGHLNMPQLRVDFTIPGSKKLALQFGAPVILVSKQRDGSLREAASRLNIPVIVYEAGEALRYNEACVRGGVHGIFNVLNYLGMYSAASRKPPKSNAIITDTSRWLRAPVSGLVVPVPDILSRRVKKGQIVATIYDPFLINPPFKVVAQFEGIVIGQALHAMATEGDALFHIASFKKIAGVRAYIDEYLEIIS